MQPILLPKNRHTDAQITTLAQAAALPLTGLDQRTDRYGPIDHRVGVVGPSAVFAANSVYLSHFRLARNFTVAKLGIYIGSVAAGNVDLGIATSADMATFTKAASTGSVSAGSTSAMMEQSLTAPYICLAGVDYWFMFGLTDATLVLKYNQGVTAIDLAQKTGLVKASAWSSGLPASVTSLSGGAFQPWFTLIA